MKHIKPLFGVWEATTACNLRCIHCGTNAGRKRGNELRTKEVKNMIDDLIDLGTIVFSVTGGEPFLRNDIFDVCEYAKDSGLSLSLLSNGMLINNEKIVKKIEILEPIALSISIDGIDEVHDNFRGVNGSFERAINALKLLKDSSIPHCTITTVTKNNINQLEELKKLMISLDVWTWQIQIGIPIGRMNKNLILTIEDVRSVAKFIADAKQEIHEIEVVAADCIGYYSDLKLRNKPWMGCHAGICLVSVTSVGDVKGCLSLPDTCIEGNIRKKSLESMWEDENSFSYNRKFDVRTLKGKCKLCEFKKECRAGCKATAFALNSIQEYPFCIK